MLGSQEKNLGQKVNAKFFRVDQGKKTKNMKKISFSGAPYTAKFC